MKAQFRVWFVLMGGLTLTACQTPESGYYPNYNNDYVYSVGYYGYRPFDWGDGYYATYGWGTRDWVGVNPYGYYGRGAYAGRGFHGGRGYYRARGFHGGRHR